MGVYMASDFEPARTCFGQRMSGRDPLIVEDLRCADRLVCYALAEVLMHAVRANVASRRGAIALSIGEGVVVIHAGQQGSAGLIAIFARQSQLSNCSLKLWTIHLGARQRIGKRQHNRGGLRLRTIRRNRRQGLRLSGSERE